MPTLRSPHSRRNTPWRAMDTGSIRQTAALSSPAIRTRPQATIDACHGCDVLIHEVSIMASGTYQPAFQAYAAKYHTSTAQLAKLATPADPLSRFDIRAPRGRRSADAVARGVARGNGVALFRTCGCWSRPGCLLSQSICECNRVGFGS